MQGNRYNIIIRGTEAFNCRATHTNLLYLAAPYFHKNKEIEEQRYRIITEVAAEMISRGEMVFSPITHNRPISDLFIQRKPELANSSRWDFWQHFDRFMLSVCSELVVLTIRGWTDSKGVAQEMDCARADNLPITFLNPELELGYELMPHHRPVPYEEKQVDLWKSRPRVY